MANSIDRQLAMTLRRPLVRRNMKRLAPGEEASSRAQMIMGAANRYRGAGLLGRVESDLKGLDGDRDGVVEASDIASIVQTTTAALSLEVKDLTKTQTELATELAATRAAFGKHVIEQDSRDVSIVSGLILLFCALVSADPLIPRSVKEELTIAAQIDLSAITASDDIDLDEAVRKWSSARDDIMNHFKAGWVQLALNAGLTYMKNTTGTITDAPDMRLAGLAGAVGTALDGSGPVSDVLNGLVPALEYLAPFLSIPTGAFFTDADITAAWATTRLTLTVKAKFRPRLLTPTTILIFPKPFVVSQINAVAAADIVNSVATPVAATGLKFYDALSVDFVVANTVKAASTFVFRPHFRIGDATNAVDIDLPLMAAATA